MDEIGTESGFIAVGDGITAFSGMAESMLNMAVLSDAVEKESVGAAFCMG